MLLQGQYLLAAPRGVCVRPVKMQTMTPCHVTAQIND